MSIGSRRVRRTALTAPVVPGGSLTLSNIARSVGSSSVTITWHTNLPADTQAALYYAPAKHCSWNWQLSGTVDTAADAQAYDIDAFDNAAAVVTELHAANRYCIAYFSGGTYENWRPDAASFPAGVRGNAVDGWAGENWLDVRQLDVLAPIMSARADVAKTKGFDGIEWDNVDGYTNNPGFPLTRAHQIAYNKMLARIAHSRGLACFLKNAVDDVVSLEPYFDGAVVEQCYQYNEADGYLPFSTAGKPVLICEYAAPTAANITDANSKGFSMIRHVLNLDRAYLASYVAASPPAVTRYSGARTFASGSLSTSHSVTFGGLTAGQRYGVLIWSAAGGAAAYDPAPQTFVG